VTIRDWPRSIYNRTRVLSWTCKNQSKLRFPKAFPLWN